MLPHQAESPHLADFIVGNLEAIVAMWEEFARATWPGEVPGATELRDNAVAMLLAVAADMKKLQSAAEQKRKSEGGGQEKGMLDGSALRHAQERISSGFDIVKLVAEFRALRASVMRIWLGSQTVGYTGQVDDLVRFNEAIDQLVTASVESHNERIEQGRRLFLGVIGHDLRQPLCSVRLLVSALTRAGSTVEPAPVLEQIQRSVDSMDALVRDLADLSSTRLGVKMAIYPHPVDLALLAREALVQAEAANPLRTFQLVSEGDLRGDWDSMRLRQVLANLLGNAAQHGSDASPVELLLHPAADDEGVEIIVRNQGRQIPADALGMLFEPLKRYSHGDAGSDGRPGSVGLGLYICQEIVKAHQGRIGVESSADGVTVFTIVLPRVASAVDPDQVPK